MGLAVLPARLKDELTLLEKCLINEADINDYESLEKHKDWFEEIKNQEWTKDNVKDQLQYELTKVFVRVLEDAGVFKLDEKGKKYFIEFIEEAIEGEE
ncbi:galactose-1-phosphate uridylyltransferase [uncultured Clostridium sp.]|nr:galactose-1-phosphate uridylyltransferase [uncultured Clostridium sp.]